MGSRFKLWFSYQNKRSLNILKNLHPNNQQFIYLSQQQEKWKLTKIRDLQEKHSCGIQTHMKSFFSDFLSAFVFKHFLRVINNVGLLHTHVPQLSPDPKQPGGISSESEINNAKRKHSQ